MNFSKEIIDELFALVDEAYEIGEIPIGSLVIKKNKIIGRGFNNRQTSHLVIGHAEINAILDAESNLNDWRLDDCILLTSVSPCSMCYEIIKAARIKKIYYILPGIDVNIYAQGIMNCVKDLDSEIIHNYEGKMDAFFAEIRN